MLAICRRTVIAAPSRSSSLAEPFFLLHKSNLLTVFQNGKTIPPPPPNKPTFESILFFLWRKESVRCEAIPPTSCTRRRPPQSSRLSRGGLGAFWSGRDEGTRPVSQVKKTTRSSSNRGRDTRFFSPFFLWAGGGGSFFVS